MAQRGSFGEERYEKEGFQKIVRENFHALHKEDAAMAGSADVPEWHMVDARQTIEEVAAAVEKVALGAIERAGAQHPPPIGKLWL